MAHRSDDPEKANEHGRRLIGICIAAAIAGAVLIAIVYPIAKHEWDWQPASVYTGA
jgi:hypothetical protein